MRDSDTHVLPEVARWLRARTTTAHHWPAERVLELKRGTRVSVVLPARNEEATVGRIVNTIRHHLVDRVPLVDEVLVVDSRSHDATAQVATAAGATVLHQDHAVRDLPRMDGKGAAMWTGLAACSGEVVAFVDADVANFRPHFVTGLLGPILADPGIDYVKGFYRRPLVDGASSEPDGGGRVTELVARPLINLFWPELAGFVQPLAGEYAGRRRALERVPFVSGYGVELGLLVDLLDLVGLDRMAQVDLGVRVHRNQGVDALGRMAAQILATAWSRLQQQGRADPGCRPRTLLAQFRPTDGSGNGDGSHHELVVNEIGVTQRPPLAALGARPR